MKEVIERTLSFLRRAPFSVFLMNNSDAISFVLFPLVRGNVHIKNFYDVIKQLYRSSKCWLMYILLLLISVFKLVHINQVECSWPDVSLLKEFQPEIHAPIRVCACFAHCLTLAILTMSCPPQCYAGLYLQGVTHHMV